MVLNCKVTVILSELQSQILKSKAESMGYRNKSDFARDLVLRDNATADKMLNEIHRAVCKEN